MEAYLQLFMKSLRSNKTGNGKCVAIAFTSSNPREGVSYVVESFGVEIARRTAKRVLIAETEDLKKADIHHYDLVAKYCSPTNLANLSVLSSKMPIETEDLPAKIQMRTKSSIFERGLYNLQTLRFCFDFILLDCPALSDSGDAAILAPQVEGVAVIVEADRTRKEQVSSAIKTIENAEGNFLGCVLNKRRYTVPNWIYKRL